MLAGSASKVSHSSWEERFLLDCSGTCRASLAEMPDQARNKYSCSGACREPLAEALICDPHDHACTAQRGRMTHSSSSTSRRQTPVWMTSWILSLVPSER
jgi:hypothetical protein